MEQVNKVDFRQESDYLNHVVIRRERGVNNR